ncbi:MAG: hypothetical protein R3C03_03375 [Pirellulaceae bacterium]
MMSFKKSIDRRTKYSKQRRNRRTFRNNLAFSRLEDRNLLAAIAQLNSITDTLTITQTADNGPITIVKNGLTGNYQITDGAGTINGANADNLIIDVSSFETNVTFDNSHAVSGDMYVDLGGPKRFVYTGKGSVGGNVLIDGGTGEQDVRFTPTVPVALGQLVIRLGSEIDQVTLNDLTVAGEVLTLDSNQITVRNLDVGLDLRYNTESTTEPGIMTVDDTIVGGELRYNGANAFDAISITNTTVAGDMVAILNQNNTSTFFNESGIVWALDSLISGNLLVTSQDGVKPDLVHIENTNITGNISLDLGETENTFEMFGGSVQGTTVSYVGGSDIDTIDYNPQTTSALAFTASMGDGDDLLTLSSGDFLTFAVDFADSTTLQNDSFVNEWGVSPGFTIDLNDLQGFDHHFEPGNYLATQKIPLTTAKFSHATPLLFPGETTAAFKSNTNSQLELFSISGDVSINLLDQSTGDFRFSYGDLMPGNVTVEMNGGDKVFTFDSESPINIAGDLNVLGLDGDQTIQFFDGNFQSNVTFDLGTGDDSINETQNPTIAGTMRFAGINSMHTNILNDVATHLSVGGNLTVDNRVDGTAAARITLSQVNVTSGLTYLGSDGDDNLALDFVNFGGNSYINVNGGTDETVTTSQQRIFGVDHVVFSGNLSVLSSSSINAADSLMLGGGFRKITVGGTFYVNLGIGNDQSEIAALASGNTTIRGNYSGAVNTIVVGIESPDHNVNIVLGSGDDHATIRNTMNVNNLRVDLGPGHDTLENQLIANELKLTFPTRFLNLDGYNVFTNPQTDSISFQQRSDFSSAGLSSFGVESGDAIYDISAYENVWTMITYNESYLSTYQFNPTASVSIAMLDYSETPVTTALSNPIEGGLRVNLGDGNRDFEALIGDHGGQKSVGLSTRIIAGEGTQSVNLNVPNINGQPQNTYSSQFRTVVSLGDGEDFFQTDGNIDVGGAFLLNGVNHFVNDQVVNVGYNMTFSSDTEFQATYLENLGLFSIANNFNYFGGNAIDTVLLKNSFNVNGNAYISLADGGTGNNQSQQARIFDSRMGSLTVVGGNATNGNDVFLGAQMTIDNSMSLIFNNTSDNRLQVFGNVLAGSIFIRTGEANDTVEFGLNADLLDAYIAMFGGEDIFRLATSADVAELTVNFGADADLYFNDFDGLEPFDVNLINLP